jgi:tRNA(adenine34) deaminase
MNSSPEHDEHWMAIALEEADRAAEAGEVPVGCVIVGSDGTELARGANLRETRSDPTAHAEVIALRTTSAHLRNWRLDTATLYVTLEPCIMCAGAIVLSRIPRVVYGCDDPKGGAVVSLYTIGQDLRLNHRFEVTRGVLGSQCSARLQSFFAALRAQGKK